MTVKLGGLQGDHLWVRYWPTDQKKKTDKQTNTEAGEWLQLLSCKYKEQNSERMSKPGGYGSPPVTPAWEGRDKIPRASGLARLHQCTLGLRDPPQ